MPPKNGLGRLCVRLSACPSISKRGFNVDIASTEIIAAALAPILLISGAGLLALSIQNRYGRVIDRIREFNTEIRDLCSKCEKDVGKRKKSIDVQTRLLIKRGIYLRNALLLLFVTVMLASFSSVFILLEAISSSPLEFFATVSFSVALISMFAGILFAIMDVALSYRAIEVEIEIERE